MRLAEACRKLELVQLEQTPEGVEDVKRRLQVLREVALTFRRSSSAANH
jgi:hypothetical protein